MKETKRYEKMRLVEPSAAYEASYRAYLADLGDAERIPYPLRYSSEPFEQFIQKLLGQSRGLGIAEGFVPNSMFWLLSADANIVGISNLRHSLTPSLEKIGGHIGFGVRPSEQRKGNGTELLRLTIQKAVHIGLTRLLLTCDKNNVGSARVITANNGRLENECVDPQTGKVVQRYWIETD